jgi:hypothetical protein
VQISQDDLFALAQRVALESRFKDEVIASLEAQIRALTTEVESLRHKLAAVADADHTEQDPVEQESESGPASAGQA